MLPAKEEIGMTHWLLQSNPDRYDTDRPDWFTEWGMATRGLAAQLQPGDQVAIWKSGNSAGVYATATVAEGEPYETVIGPDDGFKCAEDIGKRRWCVDLEGGRRLDRPVLKETLRADPRFADAAILRAWRRPNPFPLSDEEWDAICSRI
jgi:predicted RNA-binding protein with PUA-like domain